MPSEDEFEQEFKKIVAMARKQFRPTLESFFAKIIVAPGTLIDQCYAAQSKVPARILHSLQRLVELADKSQSDDVRVFWICVCAEAVIKLTGNAPQGSQKRVITFFERYIREEDRVFLETNFKRSFGDKKYFDPTNPNFDPTFPQDLKLKEIVNVLYGARSELVHGDQEYGFHFSSDGNPTMNGVNIGQFPKIDFEWFEVAIQYEHFRNMFLKAGIECIQECLDIENLKLAIVYL